MARAAVAVLALVVISVIVKAAPAINFDFITNTLKELRRSGSNEGGIANSIVGSLILIDLASAMAVPVGILTAIYTTEFAGGGVATAIRFALDMLNGIPTIVTGVFVFGIFVLDGRQSGWAGAVALAIIMPRSWPAPLRKCWNRARRSLHEAGLALGLKRWRIVLRIVLPTAMGGLLTSAVLGVARIAGETVRCC